MCHAGTSLEPVNQFALSKCLARGGLLPNQRQRLYNVLQENSGVFGSSIADLNSIPIVKQYIATGNAKPIKQRVYPTSHHHHKEIEKQGKEILKNGIIKHSITPWTSPVVLVRKADKTLRLCIDYRNPNKTTIKDSNPLPHIQDTLDTLCGNTLFRVVKLWRVDVTRQLLLHMPDSSNIFVYPLD